MGHGFPAAKMRSEQAWQTQQWLQGLNQTVDGASMHTAHRPSSSCRLDSLPGRTWSCGTDHQHRNVILRDCCLRNAELEASSPVAGMRHR